MTIWIIGANGGIGRLLTRRLSGAGHDLILSSRTEDDLRELASGASAAAKAGIEGLVRSAAATYAGRGIRVNAVAPGMVRTPLSNNVWSSDRSLEVSGWTTGAVHSVDGGLGGAFPR